MNDKIIAAAREAGFQISDQFGVLAGPMVVQSAVERLYALAYRQGLEDAAKECELNSQRWPDPRKVYVAHECAAAIRQLKENTHG